MENQDKVLTSDQYFQKTRFALILTHILNEPLFSLYALMPFILRKDLKASAFELSLFTILRPTVSVFSFYWSAYINQKKNKLRSNLIGAMILARIPFFLTPWFPNIPYTIFSAACYMLFYRASTPALMEILKINMEKHTREKLFSFVSALSYAEGLLVGLLIGNILDVQEGTWKFLFFLTASLSMLGVFIQMRVPIRLEEEEISDKKIPFSFDSLLKPWREGILLLKRKPDFARFQLGFTAGGFGMMLIIPALAIYSADILKVSHTTMTAGRCVYMGFGFVFSSSIWFYALKRCSIQTLTALICLGFALFPLFLTFATLNLFWFYFSFFLYGITQAGSHLIWHLSGSLFSEDEDSSLFSAINVLTVGLRGLIAPILGGFLCVLINTKFVLLLGTVISFTGFCYMLYKRR